MSELEKSDGRCPRCGTPSGQGVHATPGSNPAGGTVCSACGALLPPSTVDVQQPNAAIPPPVRGGKRSPLALGVAAIVISGMLYFGLHAARPSASAGFPSGNVRSADKLVNTTAPDFTLVSLEGTNLRLSDLRGKAVLLNFWATWCGPCKIEMPWFVALQNQYGSQGLQIVGVAMDEAGKDEIAKFAKQMGVNYPVLLGKDDVGDQYGGVPALPESFFISRDGKIVDKIIGLRGKAEIEDSIKKALNAPSSRNATASIATTLAPPQN